MKVTVPNSGSSRVSTESGRPSSRNNNHNRSNAPPPPVTYTSSEYSYKEDPYSPKHYHSRPSTPSTTQVKNHHHNQNHAISTQQPEYYNDDDDGYQPNNSNSYLLYPQQHQQHHGRGSYDQYPSYSEQDDYIPPFAPPPPATTNNNKIETSFDIDSDSKKNKFQQFREKGCKMWVSVVFVFIIIVAIVWYFVWPRLFTLSFVSASLNTDTEYNWIMVNNNNTDSQQQQLPAGVTAQWNISLNANNADNWVPTQVQDLYMEIINIGTGITFGKGHSGSLVLPAKSYQTIYFNVSIDYHPLKIDDTLRDLLNACYHNGSTSSNTPSQGLRVVLDITYYIRGIAWTSRAHNRVSQLACPS